MDTCCEYHAFAKKIKSITEKLTDDQRKKYEEEAEANLRRAAIWLLLQQPFFGLLLCDMTRVPCWSLNPPTLAVDGIHLYYHPVCVSLFNTHEKRGVLCHEALHLVYSHLSRRGSRDSLRWNQAGDFAINRDIKEECKDMALPSWVCYDPKFKDMYAEQIYRLLQESPSGGAGGEGDSDGEQKGKGKDPCPECEKERSGGQHVFDEHRQPKVTQDELMDRVIRAADQAEKMNKGSVPSSVTTLIRKLREPKVDWRKFIRGRALDIFNKRDYHPEVRSIITGAVASSMGVGSTWIPGLAAEESRTLVVVIDTSGSVYTEKILRSFASEVKGVMELAEKTIVITADAAVHEQVEVAKFDDILAKMKFRGGGGTDFRPAFKAVEKMGVVPELLIYFTDAEGDFPKQCPNYPVMWALTKHHGAVPWGDSVVVPEEEKEE